MAINGDGEAGPKKLIAHRLVDSTSTPSKAVSTPPWHTTWSFLWDKWNPKGARRRTTNMGHSFETGFTWPLNPRSMTAIPEVGSVCMYSTSCEAVDHPDKSKCMLGRRMWWESESLLSCTCMTLDASAFLHRQGAKENKYENENEAIVQGSKTPRPSHLVILCSSRLHSPFIGPLGRKRHFGLVLEQCHRLIDSCRRDNQEDVRKWKIEAN